MWVLTDGRAGDDAQSTNLAKALGWPYEAKRVGDSLCEVILDRLCDAVGLRLAPRMERPAGGWPDLIIGVGGRNVSAARRIRRDSGGCTRIVFLGRPWSSLHDFDLVVTTPQYRLPTEPNVLHIMLPLNRVEPSRLSEAALRRAPDFSHLPQPWLGVVVGGNSGSFRLTRRSARKLAEYACDRVAATGGSLLVTTSPRTPSAGVDSLCANLTAPHFVYRWRPNDANNPYVAILALANAFLVTGESASMVAETVNTGKPVEIFGLKQRLLSRILTSSTVAGGAFFDAPGERQRSAWSRCRSWLVRRGLWVPARDLRYLHAVLYHAGVVTGADGDATSPYGRFPNDLACAVKRVRALFGYDQVLPVPGLAQRDDRPGVQADSVLRF